MSCKGILNASKLFPMHSNNKKLAEAIGCLETSARVSVPAPHDCWVLAPCMPRSLVQLTEMGSRADGCSCRTEGLPSAAVIKILRTC